MWFDRLQISPNCTEHLESLNPMCEELKKLIDQEVKEGIPLNRIVIGKEKNYIIIIKELNILNFSLKYFYKFKNIHTA